MNEKIAKIAVSAATYWIDKPYDYLIPEEFAGKVCAGMRVFVPFGKGNRRSEGIVLGVYDRSEYDALKPITALPDDAPVLSDEQISVEYAYAFITPSVGNAYVIIRVEDNDKASEILKGAGIELIEQDDIFKK